MVSGFNSLSDDEQIYLSMAIEHGGAFTVHDPSDDGSRLVAFGSRSRTFSKDEAEQFVATINSMVQRGLVVVIREKPDLSDYELTPEGRALFPDSA